MKYANKHLIRTKRMSVYSENFSYIVADEFPALHVAENNPRVSAIVSDELRDQYGRVIARATDTQLILVYTKKPY